MAVLAILIGRDNAFADLIRDLATPLAPWLLPKL
jgi:hypothetical protein